MAAALIVRLRWHEKLESCGWYGEFFLIVGMATSYFDFLTYPLVTLGFPLCVCLYFSRGDWKAVKKKEICFSIQWGAGYMGMWAMKWILADILLGGNVIADAMNTFFERTGAAQGQSAFTGFWTVLVQNAEPYKNWTFYLLTLGIFLWLGGLLWKEKERLKNKEQVFSGILLGCVAFFPFVWFFFTQNHSQQHWMFTCKIFAVSVFALSCGAVKMIRTGEEQIEKEERDVSDK